MTRRISVVLAGVGCLFLAMASPAIAVPALVNPGFEDFHEDNGPRPSGWGYWDNIYTVLDDDLGPAHTGDRKVKIFGNWGWPWNAAGCTQEFPTQEGDTWELSAWVKQDAVDGLVGTENFLVLKIEFQDAGGGVTGAPEANVLNGNSPVGQWFRSETVVGVAPPGTTKVIAVVVFLQPNFEGGAALVDDVVFWKTGPAIPTLPEWGIAAMVLLVLTGGTVVFGRRRKAVQA